MKIKLSILIALFLVSINCFAQGKNKDADNLVQALVEKYMDLDGTPPGISVAISQNNEISFAKGFGYANVAKNEPVTIETQFRTASVAKLITATSLARLIQENKIDINEPISTYFKSVPKEYSKITTKQLTGHIGGVTHYSQEQRVENRFYSSIEDALSTFIHIKPLSISGTTYKYSSYGYVLLSKIIENASGKPFLIFLDEQLFEPLNMRSTSPEFKTKPSINMAELYDINEEGVNKGYPSSINEKEDLSYKWAGGGFISTPTDLLKLANTYTNGFFREDVVELMFKSLKLKSGMETGVGIGWRGNYDMANRRIFEHAGYMRGTRSVVSIFPDEKISIAIMTNSPNLNRIEESGHMLALPYLTKASPKEQPTGIGELNIETIDYDGNLTTENATLILNGETDRIIFEDGVTYSLIYMQRYDIYALIHKDGILYMELNVENGKVNGKVIRYKSPLTSSPSSDKPFMKIKGDFKQ
jgi:CubicO group peptidase (beta-lactamase class C family)